MLTKILRTIRLSLRGSGLAVALRKLGITSLGRALYERRVLSRGTHKLVLLGQQMKFRTVSRIEVSRLDSMAREEPMLQRLRAVMQPGDVFYDVGANVGIITTTIACACADSNLRIHAFEPEPRHAEELRFNLQLNGLRNVTVHQLALSDQSGQAQLSVDDRLGSGGHSLVRSDLASRRPVEIRTITAAELVAGGTPLPQVAKIDVEGAEMRVLKGMRPLLEQGAVRDLFIEVHPAVLQATGSSAKELERWLNDLDYQATWRHDMTAESHQHYCRSTH